MRYFNHAAEKRLMERTNHHRKDTRPLIGQASSLTTRFLDDPVSHNDEENRCMKRLLFCHKGIT